MVTSTTTIQITTEQKSELDSLKRDGSESYKSVLQELIDNYSNSTERLDETRVREIAVEEINERVTYRALE